MENNILENNTFNLPVVTEDQLIKELSQERQAAVGVTNEGAQPGEATQISGGNNQPAPFTFGDPPPDEPLPPAEPIFTTAPAPTTEGEDQPTEAIKPINKAAAKRKLETMLKARDMIQARLLQKLAKTKDKTRFKLDEEGFEMLVEAYLPYMEQHGEKIPVWIDLLLAELIVTGSLIIEAVGERKVNVKNEEIVSSGNFDNKEAFKGIKMVKAERKRSFQIDDQGYWIKMPNGDYIKQPERTEKASAEYLPQIAAANPRARVQSVFKLSDEQTDKIYQEAETTNASE